MKKKSTKGTIYPFLNINSLRKMKLIVSLILLSLFQLSAIESYAQNAKINLSLKNVSLNEAIKLIEDQTDFVFFYNNAEIDLTRKVNADISNGNIKEFLNEVLGNYNYRIENKKIVLTPKETQQLKKINGTITDASGVPIIGANVVVKGSTTGTVTDIDGNFSLEVSQGSSLEISYIGYLKKEIIVNDKNSYLVQLTEDSKALDEVVVVGYGTEKKVNVIGSIAQIGSDRLENRSTPQLSNALTGQMSGVTVIQRSGRPGDSSGQIRVRGVGSFGATPDALVLVDGLPGSLNDINPEDVESISVLKDASTAAIYGARAANGVVLVTTKGGKEGKLIISYNGYVGTNIATELPEFVNSWEYATLMNEAEGREIYSTSDIQKFKDGSDPDNYSNSNYLKEILSKNGFQTGHDLSLNGGTSSNRYLMSFGYLNQNGLVEKNNYERFNARINLATDILSNLTVTTRLSGVYSTVNEPSVPGGPDVNDVTGIIQKAVRFPGLYATKLLNGNYGPGAKLQGNPKSWVESASFFQNPSFKLNANLRLDYSPLKDIKLSVIGGFNYQNDELKRFRSTLKLDGDRTLGPSSLTQEMLKTIYKTFQSTAEFNKSFNTHNLGILAGYSWEDQSYRNLSGSRDKFPGNDLPYMNAGSPDNQKADGGGYEWAIQSLFGRVKYNYNERYLFESTLRYDGSSRFPTKEKYGIFPSLAAGWRLSEERFIKDNEKLTWITNLKIKASAGILGNQNIGNYPYQTVFVLGQNYPFGENYSQGAAITTATDPTIKWEETRTVDGGFEALFWNGLLSTNVSYFYRKTYDILYKPSGSISSILGQNISEMNTGELENRGWEFEFGHRNKIGGVSYTLNANFSIINNKVLNLGLGNVEQLNGMVGNGSNLFIGCPMELYYGYKTDGVFLDQADIDSWYNQKKVTPSAKPGDIRYKDISGPDGVPDGVIDPNYDRVPLGSRIPKYTFGLNLGIDYKGFDFQAQFQGVAGVKGLLNEYSGFAFWSEGNIQRWQADGRFSPNNPQRYPDYPRLENLGNVVGPNTQTSDFWILDASYVRLKNIQIGYTIPIITIKKIGLSQLRFYVSSENPLCWNKYREGWDPEINSNGSFYPILTTYTFGVNLKF